MIAQPDRVQIWASQLAANDFPPVCAMTGRPAELWRKFKFSTPPAWVYWLLFLIIFGGLGIILYAVVVTVVSNKATGHLPLTRAAQNRLRLIIGAITTMLPLSFVLFFIGLVVNGNADANSANFGPLLIIVGLVSFTIFLILALMRGLFGPRGNVREPQPGQVDKLVELRNVHPNFVAAVQQQHSARWAQTSQPGPAS